MVLYGDPENQQSMSIEAAYIIHNFILTYSYLRLESLEERSTDIRYRFPRIASSLWVVDGIG